MDAARGGCPPALGQRPSLIDCSGEPRGRRRAEATVHSADGQRGRRQLSADLRRRPTDPARAGRELWAGGAAGGASRACPAGGLRDARPPRGHDGAVAPGRQRAGSGEPTAGAGRRTHPAHAPPARGGAVRGAGQDSAGPLGVERPRGHCWVTTRAWSAPAESRSSTTAFTCPASTSKATSVSTVCSPVGRNRTVIVPGSRYISVP